MFVYKNNNHFHSIFPIVTIFICGLLFGNEIPNGCEWDPIII